MGWLDDFSTKTVAIDTPLVIFYIEQNASYINIVRPFFQAADRGDFRIVTSVVTLIEVLI